MPVSALSCGLGTYRTTIMEIATVVMCIAHNASALSSSYVGRFTPLYYSGVARVLVLVLLFLTSFVALLFHKKRN